MKFTGFSLSAHFLDCARFGNPLIAMSFLYVGGTGETLKFCGKSLSANSFFAPPSLPLYDGRADELNKEK